jgi:propionyl-CoA carboxylase alpha chain
VTGDRARLPRQVLIANRGEIAVRIARTCRSMGIATVGVFSDVDEHALHVRACDQAVRLGGATPAESYLRVDALLEAARVTGADAVHPGYGFLAEHAGFARAVVDAGLTWIGPSPGAIAAMGDKLEAKRRMAAAGVPLVPGAELPDDVGSDDLARVGAEVGYPLMVKAAAGGGGKGMRVVADAGDLADAIAAARREARGAFGDGTVFLERFVSRSRHIEVQVLGDADGTVLHAFERECSIQRRHQKVVEESPSPGIDAEVRAALCAAAVDAAAAIGYVGAGTVEFIADEAKLAARRAGEPIDPDDCFAFLEVNTRLQVEHPVTEAVVHAYDVITGALTPLDLVRCQLLVAAGAGLPFEQEDLRQVGHAIEVRLYAEDPANGYLPATGTLSAFEPASGTGVRWDAGVVEGDAVSVHYDPMLAKVIAHGPTRDEAAGRLGRALDDTVLLGVRTNRDLLVEVLQTSDFLTGGTTTAYLDEHHPDDASRRFRPSEGATRIATLAVVLAGIDDRAAPARPAVRPGFTNAGAFDPEIVLAVGDVDHRLRYRVARDGSVQVHRVDADGGTTGVADPVRLHARRGDRLELEVDGRRLPVRVTTRGPSTRWPRPSVGSRSSSSPASPMPPPPSRSVPRSRRCPARWSPWPWPRGSGSTSGRCCAPSRP